MSWNEEVKVTRIQNFVKSPLSSINFSRLQIRIDKKSKKEVLGSYP